MPEYVECDAVTEDIEGFIVDEVLFKYSDPNNFPFGIGRYFSN